MTALQIIWWFLIGILFMVYTILDGYDLGAGVWHLFAKNEDDKRKIIASIAPFWDGNEVWLLTGGGALFAAFPHAYATIFSAFYIPLIIILIALIFRAVSIEFRNKESNPSWRKFWDIAFGIGSLFPSILFGIAMGNILRGIPLDEHMTYTGTFLTLLNPYALLWGLFSLLAFLTHGAFYLALKNEGDFQKTMLKRGSISSFVYLIFFVLVIIATVKQPYGMGNFGPFPPMWILPLLQFLMIILSSWWGHRGDAKKAFMYTSRSIALIWMWIGAMFFPVFAFSPHENGMTLTIENSSSSELTLKIMLILALIGMPIVIAYTFWVHRIFGGKTNPDDGY